MKLFTKEWDMQIVSSHVSKHRRGENSTFNNNTSKEFWFDATFNFNTGSRIKISMVEPREEYADMDTMKISYKDQEQAKKLAWEEYQRVIGFILDPAFLYSRHMENPTRVNFYGKDKSSPTGVTLMGAASLFKVADFVQAQIGIGSGSLSPTEDLRSAR